MRSTTSSVVAGSSNLFGAPPAAGSKTLVANPFSSADGRTAFKFGVSDKAPASKAPDAASKTPSKGQAVGPKKIPSLDAAPGPSAASSPMLKLALSPAASGANAVQVAKPSPSTVKPALPPVPSPSAFGKAPAPKKPSADAAVNTVIPPVKVQPKVGGIAAIPSKVFEKKPQAVTPVQVTGGLGAAKKAPTILAAALPAFQAVAPLPRNEYVPEEEPDAVNRTNIFEPVIREVADIGPEIEQDQHMLHGSGPQYDALLDVSDVDASGISVAPDVGQPVTTVSACIALTTVIESEADALLHEMEQFRWESSIQLVELAMMTADVVLGTFCRDGLNKSFHDTNASIDAFLAEAQQVKEGDDILQQ
jgi:hypothetical protein